MILHEFNTEFTWRSPQGPYRRITEQQAKDFDEKGFFVLEDAMDRALLDSVVAAIDPLEAKEEQELRDKHGGKKMIARAGEITFTTQLALRVPAARDFICGPIFQDLCHDLIGPNARLYWDMAVYKKPGTTAPFPWHQDNGYTFVDPQAYVTCWVALSDATVKNGCLWALPGEHKRGTFSHRVTRVGLVCLYDDPPTRVALPMRAGSIAVMSSLTPHATGANLSDATRKGLVAEFMPDGAGTIRKTETGELVRTPLVGPHNMWVLKDGKAPAA